MVITVSKRTLGVRGIGKLDCPVRIPMPLGPYHVTSPLQLSKHQLPGPETGSLGVFHSPGQMSTSSFGCCQPTSAGFHLATFPRSL